MQASHPGLIRLGALATGLSAMLYLAFGLLRPVTVIDVSRLALDLSRPDHAARVFASEMFVFADMLLLASFTLLPIAALTLHAYLANSPGERWSFWGMVLLVTSVGPFQAFTAVGALGFSAASRVYLEGYPGGLKVLEGLTPWLYAAIGIVGGSLLLAGSVALAVAIWRSGVLPRWSGVLYAMGFILLAAAVASPADIQKAVRVGVGLLGGLSGLWIAWCLWRKPSGAG